MFLATTPPPETIRQKATEVVARPEYQLEQGLDEGTQALWLTILSWILKPFIWLFEALDGLPIAVRILVIIVLAIVAVALMGHIAWSLIAAIRQTPRHRQQTSLEGDRPLDPEELEAAAQSAASGGEHLEAVRLLFRAALRRIEQAEDRKFRLGITNRELLRRYGRSPLFDPLQLFVETIDRKWYGGEVCQPADYEQCREGHVRIRTLTQGGTDALRA